ncbi:retrotransposon hot spot (RHS) protein [Trypanosoma cruzi]|nr:retrotransposon hot spot (RHS) protein [Trypanosoma cruzi]
MSYQKEWEGAPCLPSWMRMSQLQSNRKTLVGLPSTTASEHHTTTSALNGLNDRLAYFNGWEEFSEGLSWDMIYVQHADNTPMNNWQRCGVVDSNNLSDDEKEIAAFWKEKVHQYYVSISSRDFRRDKSLRSEEEPKK